MPLEAVHGQSTLFVRRAAFERGGLTRGAIDAALTLTADEFRVEGDLIAIGPVYDGEALAKLVAELERLGLEDFDDFFELSGNWPEWLQLFVMAAPAR
jgi:hypothetical protein